MTKQEKSPPIAGGDQTGDEQRANANIASQSPVNQLARAIAYAVQVPVFPLHTPILTGPEPKCSCGNPECTSIGKHPRTRNGLHDATTDAGTITRWWSMWPDANIGMPTGKASGVVVLDVDEFDSLTALEEEHGKLPDGPVVLTGGGGLHLYFRAPDLVIPNSASKLGPGLDIRGGGGYVVLPPSLHVSGKRYQWLEGRLSNVIER